MVVEVLRMPLNAQEEGFRGIFHGFHHPIFGTGGDKQGGGPRGRRPGDAWSSPRNPRRAHHRFSKLPLAMVTLWDMP